MNGNRALRAACLPLKDLRIGRLLLQTLKAEEGCSMEPQLLRELFFETGAPELYLLSRQAGREG